VLGIGENNRACCSRDLEEEISKLEPQNHLRRL
jgi:hypothetical protein